MAAPQTISDEFNDSYSQQGLQPSVGSVTPIRKVRAEYKNNPTIRRGGKSNIIDFRTATKRLNKENTKKRTAQTPIGKISAVALNRTGVGVAARASLKITKSHSSTHDVHLPEKEAKLIAAGLNKAIYSAGLYTWSTLQLPMAIISLVFLSLSLLSSYLYSTVTTIKDDDGIMVGILKTGTKVLLDTAAAMATAVNTVVTKLTGINLEAFLPLNIFMLGYTVVFTFGMFTLFVCYLVYKVALLEPLSGDREGLKLGVLILAIAGYMIPFLNMMPCFMVWAMVVKRFPR